LKKILLISDTHGTLDSKLTKYIEAADEVWHAGDIGNIELCRQLQATKPLRAVFGNIDDQEIRSFFPENLIFLCEEVKVFITHIAGYPGKFSAKIKEKIKENKPNLFICGHSHILKVMYDKENEMLFMNPGACGNQGFHKVKTAVRFEIDQSQIKNLEVIELGLRALG
jgi:uncharacterized protein